jgi:hypothetical protein
MDLAFLTAFCGGFIAGGVFVAALNGFRLTTVRADAGKVGNSSRHPCGAQ